MTHPLVSDSRVASVGHYELRKCLGEGGFGQVYEAWDQTLKRSVALKCLNVSAKKSGRDKLIDEARLAASLQHLAFVKIFGFEDDGHSQYIIMELVRGNTLRNHAPEPAHHPARALDLVDQVAAAMVEAHESGLVHGDLKPSNLMLEASGTVRILDFGLARHFDPLATQSGVCEDPKGTIAYMAPERLIGRPPEPVSDIYSLGVVLYELIAGERPFATLHGMALVTAHLQSGSDRWQFPTGIDRDQLQLILAMTARDPALRLPSMAAVRERIGQIRGAAPQPAASLSPPPRPTRWWAARNVPRQSVVLAGAMAIGAAALAMSFTPPIWRAVPAPFYSDSASMQAGMEALRHADRDGAIDTALQRFDDILARHPKHAGAAAGQSLAYSMRYVGDGRDETLLRRAAAGARLAIQEDDQLAIAHAAQAWVAALEGRGTEALRSADRALALDPGDLSALHAKINVLLRMQRYPAALQLIDAAQARLPQERIFADLEGTLNYQQGDYRRAEQAFRRSLQLEPDAVLAYANLSAALLRQGKRDDALRILQQGLRLQQSGVLYSNLGTVLFDRGDFLGASAAFEHAVSAAKGGPNDYIKWANLADALRWIPGREEDSWKAYRRAMQLLHPLLERAPDDPTFLTRMGLYAAHIRDEPEALAWTERGVAAAPANPDVRFRAALANEIGGRRDAAIAHLTRATALGYPFSSIESEPEFVALRRDARYQTLAMKASK